MGATTSRQQIKSPPFPNRWKSLPMHLVQLGVDTFGSRAKLEAALSKTAPPSLVAFPEYGVAAWMVQLPGDTSVQRISYDSLNEGDSYGLRRVSETTGLLVDIGANLGDMTICMAKLRPAMQILAVEPVPSTYFYMRWNLLLNGVATISSPSELGPNGAAGVLAMNAATTPSGNLTSVAIRYNARSSQDAGLDSIRSASSRFKQKYAGWQTRQVAAMHLPSAIGAWRRVALLKLDCEMCEYDLIGADADWFVDRSVVRRVGGELHGRSPSASNRTLAAVTAALQRRGCPTPNAGTQRMIC